LLAKLLLGYLPLLCRNRPVRMLHWRRQAYCQRRLCPVYMHGQYQRQ
jgi:hypothetical protein